jgi:hypothetical protein
MLPAWIPKNRSGGQFWTFIKAKSPTYQGRREFIWGELERVFAFVEQGFTQPTAASLEPLLRARGSAALLDAWSRIHARRASDPEGAITAARTLLESVCKHLLEELGLSYAPTDDLPQLYSKLAEAMNLGPQSHKEQVFKQILGGCMTVANGLASLRNTFGDAHGKGKKAPRPAPRHADLAVNLAGTIAAFLLATYEQRQRLDRSSAT